eukprot:TRINITY_DN9931_c0_g1_i1.p1 TRINITY_DN9931_c0_g1~~TRINITY_DN9931_c0_g1_i1.p1  ORF type:complete len:459 (-),score=65.42 TRINITY_DN9931_c0_g1_i1:22-1365(-)
MSENISVGCLVRIKDLKSRTDLNGRCAKVLSFSSESGRWECELLAAGGGAAREERGYVQCQPGNLELVMPSSSHGSSATPPPTKRVRLGNEEGSVVDGDSLEFQQQVATFLSHPLLQPHAIQQFMAMTPQQQWQIMQRGSLADARDPTAVLISRISQARAAASILKGATAARIANGGSLPSFNGGSQARGEGMAFAGGDQRHQQMFARPSPSYTQPVLTDPTAFDAGVAFYLAHPLLARMAQQQFLALSFEQQMRVMEQGNLSGSDDPSFVLLSRISQVGPPPPKTGFGAALAAAVAEPQAPSPAAQAFFDSNGIQPHAVQRFLSLTPHQQERVMQSGSLDDARDPTAVFLARIAKVAASPGPGQSKFGVGPLGSPGGQMAAGAPATEEEAQAFLAPFSVQPHAAQRFLALSAVDKGLVMARGSLANVRDPTAVLVSRINSVGRTGM